MQRLDLLITEARQATDNEDVSETTGIPTALFVKWANQAQEHLQSQILKENPKLFQATAIQSVSAGQEAYSIPTNTFMGTRIEKVEFSVNGTDFYELGLWGAQDRITSGGGGTPRAYIRQSSQILLQPKPTGSGTLRYTYQTHLPRLDIRRGTVASATLGGGGITSLILDSTVLLPEDITAVVNRGFGCIVDKDGAILMAGIPITGIDEVTGVVTIGPQFFYESGESIPIGSYLVAGKYASTHSHLPDACEGYLAAYMEWKAFKKDSSSDAAGAKEELVAMENQLIEAYRQAEPNSSGIPITNTDFM